MSTVNDKIFDRIVDHLGDVRLYENGVQKGNREILSRHRNNLRGLLRGDIRADVKPEVQRFADELHTHQRKSLSEFSRAQTIFHSNNIDREVKAFYRTTKPQTTELLKEITGGSIKGTPTLTGNLRNISSGELVRIQTKVKAGLAKGLTKDEIISDVLKTTKITEHQAKTLTRTSITTTQSAALRNVMEANKEILDGYMFTAILDGRTSPICSHHNGKVYDVDDKRFTPPLHWNCRSSMVPVVKSKEELEKVESKKIKPRKLQQQHPADLNGNPSKIKTYSDWLRRQPTDVQIKQLGSEKKAKLFQRGRLKAEEFVTPQGKALSSRGLMRRANQTVSRPTADNISDINLRFRNPNELMSSKQNIAALRAHFIADAADNKQALSLVDFKGNSLAQKNASRRYFKANREGAMFNADGADWSNDALRHMQRPEPEILAERLAKVAESVDLTADQKKFIKDFVGGTNRSLSVNQRSVVTDVLRQTFIRHNKDGLDWGQSTSVFRKYTINATQDLGTLMFNRSTSRAQMFGNITSAIADDPEVNIFGRRYTMSQIIDDQIKDNRYIEIWRGKEGTKLAKKAYYNRKAPIAAYTQPIIKRYPSMDEFKKKLLKQIPGYETVKDAKKFYDSLGEPSDAWITRKIASIRGKSREILDGEFLYARDRKAAQAALKDKSIKALAKSMESIAVADGADYDQLAIKIGRTFDDELGNLNPFRSKTLSDFHKDGSKIIQSLEKQGMIRIDVFRSPGTTSPIDLATGRPSSVKSLRGQSITRQISIVNGPMRQLQVSAEKARTARRFGVYKARDRVYARAGEKDYFDARGRKSNVKVVSDGVYADYDPKQIDRDMANMLNHAKSVKYEVDPDFYDFAERVIYYSDKRGQAKYWDERNVWKELFMSRGNDGRGVLSTAKFYRKKGVPFQVDASIDFRGRVYHRGLLTPTKGETVRPFLNTHKAVAINPDVVEELQTQLGALLGPALDTLTVQGRLRRFKANEKFLDDVYAAMSSKTQPDRRVKEFLELMHGHGVDDEEVGKLARLVLEYGRIKDHMGGKMYIDKTQWSSGDIKRLGKYKTKMMIENDASSSGAQIISLSTGDRRAADLSNVVQTTKKQRLYDEIAKRTVDDPEFLAIPELQDLDLDWTDLMKAAKNQNMVTFYGAGDATKANNVANQFAKVLAKKGKVTISAGEVDKFKKAIDAKISFEMDKKNWTRIDELRDIKRQVVLSSREGKPITESLYDTAKAEFRDGIKASEDMHTFLTKLTDETGDLVGTRVFEKVSNIMSRHLEADVPVTGKFIKFWKDIAKDYVSESGSVDIPWVTFDGKKMMQRYRVKEQTRIDFTDPVTGEKVFNIYEEAVKDGKLMSPDSIQRAAIGLGVNGNHSNDAVIVRKFHLWGRKNNVDTGTIHDAFFTNIGDAIKAKSALRDIYADALKEGTIEKTLKAMRGSGMSPATYRKYLDRAKADGLIYDPRHPSWKQKMASPDWETKYKPITPRELTEKFRDGHDWYGIGP